MDNDNNQFDSPERRQHNQQQFETPPGQILRGNPANPPQLRRDEDDNLEPPLVRRRLNNDLNNIAPRNLGADFLWVRQVAGQNVVTPDGNERRSRARQNLNGSSVVTPAGQRIGENVQQLARRLIERREAEEGDQERGDEQPPRP